MTSSREVPLNYFLSWLAVLLLAPLVLAQTDAESRGDVFDRAQKYAQEKRYDEALTIFEDLVRRNTRDIEARNWVARIESWQGRLPVAERAYRDVLAEVPGNGEALLGLADVLSWQNREREALPLLETLRQQEPQNVEALLRLGRFSLRQGRRSQAMDYYRSVLALQPANAEAREAVETLAEQRPFRFETGYFREEFDFASSTNGNFLELLYRDWDRLSLLTRLQVQNKFSQTNARFTLGATYRFWSRTYLRAEASWAPPSHTVVANQDYAVEWTQGLPAHWAIGAGFRHLQFQDATVAAFTPLLNWEPGAGLRFFFRYSPIRTRFDLPPHPVWNHNGSARLVWDAHKTFSPFLIFAVGNESFSGLSAEQLGRFAAHTYGGGLELRLTPTQGWRFGYHFQKRTQDRQEQLFEAAYFLGF